MASFHLPSNPSTTASTPVPRHISSNNSTYSYSEEDYDYSDEDTLPYPTDLPRTDFLSPTFNASTYLSTLSNRHQTLEDLRSDLRARSQLLNQELIDLVNGNYEEFLGLGGDLRGGEVKVEGLKVGVLGFEREVRAILARVREREREVRELVGSLREVRREGAVGRALLDFGERVEELEGGLGLGVIEREEEGFDEEVEDEVDGEVESVPGLRLGRLKAHVRDYVLLERTIEHIGPEHPFLAAQKSRIAEIRKTLLLDLAAGLRAAKTAKASEATLEIVRLYGDLGAESESVRVLRAG